MRELRISGFHYKQLKDHLFPGDGKEAVSIALCGRHEWDNKQTLLVHKLVNIPYEDCKIREHDLVKWSTNILIPHLIDASKKGWGIVKVHSHPNGYANFSETDNTSDKELFDSVFGWMNNENSHGSIIMLPDGSLFGRFIESDLRFEQMNKISLSGDDIRYWYSSSHNYKSAGFNIRTEQTFGKGTLQLLKGLKVGVIGCSGTGSPTIEQLVRLGVGSLVLIDPDKVEEKNLNRILNTTISDVKESRYKVDVLSEIINKIGLGTEVKSYKNNLYDNFDAIHELASCDIIFGCVDSVDGRHLINQIANFYLIPYFDLGVKVIADGKGSVDQICGTINYLQPRGSSLMSRGLYSNEELRAAGLYRVNPKEYETQKKSGYIVNVNVDSPAVISINMQTASIAVNEFLARIHPFRYDPNSEFAITRFSITDAYVQREDDGIPDEYLVKYVGRGDIIPLLNMPELS